MLSMNNLHPLMNTTAWIPLLIFSCDKICHQAGKTSRNILLFALIYGLQILSGHLELVAFESLLLLAYVALHLSRQSAFKLIGQMALAVLLGIGLSCIQWLPSLLYLPLTERQAGVGLKIAETWSIHPLLNLLFILPDVQGNALQSASLHGIFSDKQFGIGALFFSFYHGVANLFFALFALPSLRGSSKTKYILFWTTMAGVSLILALGKFTPLYGLIYTYLPGFNLFRYPSKLLIFASLSLAILTGFGFQAFLNVPSLSPLKRSLGFLVLGMLLSFLLFCLLSEQGRLPQHFFEQLTQQTRPNLDTSQRKLLIATILGSLKTQILHLGLLLGVLTACLALALKRPILSMAPLILLLSLMDLGASGINVLWFADQKAFQQKGPVAEYLLQLGQDQDPNNRIFIDPTITTVPESFRPQQRHKLGFFTYGMLYFQAIGYTDILTGEGIRQSMGVWPAKSQQIQEMEILHLAALNEDKPYFRNELESLISAHYLITVNPQAKVLHYLSNSADYQLKQSFADTQVSIWENKNVLPRLRFQTQAHIVHSPEEAKMTLMFPQQSHYHFKQEVLLSQNEKLNQVLKTIPEQNKPQIQDHPPRILLESNQKLELKLSNSKAGYLVLADQWTPGWSATDNDHPTPILRANYFERALRLAPGHHKIAFHYQAPGLKTGALITGASLLLWLLLWFWPSRRSQAARLETAA